jgi:hypothetical protein
MHMPKKKIWIIAGSRHFDDPHYMSSKLTEYAETYGYPCEVVSGAAKGADHCGELWAANNGIPIKRFPADWAQHGRAAGPIRNAAMANYAGKSGILFLFWDGTSPGSASMLHIAQKYGIPVIQFIDHITKEEN